MIPSSGGGFQGGQANGTEKDYRIRGGQNFFPQKLFNTCPLENECKNGSYCSASVRLSIVYFNLFVFVFITGTCVCFHSIFPLRVCLLEREEEGGQKVWELED